MLYFAFGANLNKKEMEYRCPDATPIKALAIKDWRLMFRGVADIEHHEGSLLHGGLWDITTKDEKKLDSFEGVKYGNYCKQYFKYDGEDVLVYKMINDKFIWPPSNGYLSGIKEGYDDFGINKFRLWEALVYSWENESTGEDVMAALHERMANPHYFNRPRPYVNRYYAATKYGTYGDDKWWKWDRWDNVEYYDDQVSEEEKKIQEEWSKWVFEFGDEDQ